MSRLPKDYRRIDEASARRIADVAALLAGFRVGPLSVRQALRGRRPWIGAGPVRVAIEAAGLYCPPEGSEGSL
jgi:hypothetical protein